MNNITVLFPGGFKPLTGAHMALAERYAELPSVSRVILLIGEKPRDGITREKTIEIFNLLNTNPKIEIQPTAFNSPIMAAYEFLFELPEDSVGDYAMAASTKGDDYVRTKDFVPNVDKYRMIGDKKGRVIPNGVNATELSVDVDPLLYSNGTPISASTIRQAIADNDYETFRMSYPENTDAEVKNIWQILRGTQESIFSSNWWKTALSEDVEEVVEAIMNPKEKHQHSAKIKKLRSFLDNNQDKSFVYDFDKFTKTVYGAKLTEGIIAENYITREELSTIEATVDSFFKQYNIDVNFQGRFTHFLERLNDPRNEAPIYMDEIKDFFEDLATEYGDKIARQLDLERPSGVGSDYQFDIPIHMPFMLQWNPGKKMIELIPRTIKKQRDRWKSNNPDDIIYKIESVQQLKEVINGDEIECDNCDWSWPIKEGGKDLYVCHECGHDNNPKLVESVTCEICKTSMKQITPNHLRYKHQLTIVEYKKQFPDAKMISESLRISLSKNNPMNDHAAVDKIKQTKLEKYGNPSFNNIKKQQQTLMETYGVSNTAALPHNIERAKKQLDDIRIRAYESGRYLDPADKPAYIRYRDTVRKLSERTIKLYKTQITNIEKRGHKFHLDHKYSIFEGFSNNIDADILAHICNLEILPSTINESKNIKSSITLIELIQSIKEHDTRELLVCGGAAGHMAHPWDDHGLSFNDMKEIVARALTGRLDIETAVTEKTDGQNIQITWKNGEIGFARGIGTIINPMTTTEIIADFHRKQQKAIAEKGAAAGQDYQRVVDAYQACAEDLSESLKSIPEATLQDIFKNGTVFANMEIIYPATKNVIAYDKAHLQFHNLVEYDANGKAVQTDLTGGAMMQKIIQDANAHMQKTFSFIPPQRIKLGRVYDFEDQQAAFFNEINQLQRKFNLKDTDLISEYHKAWWRDVIQTKAKQMGYEIPEDVLNTLMYRWAFNNKSTNISILKKQIDNPGFLNWVAEFDKKDFKGFQKENLEPFETIFLRLGVLVLQNATNYLAANPDTTVQDIKSELTQLIRDLQAKGDPAVLKQLEMQLKRIQRLGGFDAIVPTEGIVFTFQGNTYKMTGAFAPINQILGTLKYAR